MNKRTKINKNSLESIGCNNHHNKQYYSYCVNEDQQIYFNFDIEERVVSIDGEDMEFILDRPFTYIDEITTLLEGLTGKNQFYKK